MEDIQTLAALQEALIKARIKFTTGTAAQWATANPVLLDGEVGAVKGTSPAQFKIGDGTKTWSQLGWGNVTNLAQLAGDATHRTVTDAEKAAWNNKAEKTAATTAADGLMSKTDKAKLDGVAAGANNDVHPANHSATMITPDATHRFVTDTQIAGWNNKAEKTAATTAADGLMSKTDKAKLDGVAAGANNYVHPANHSATMITPDATHRFVTDTQIAGWNNKAEKTAATTAAAGLMSAADKTKLDGVAAGANNYVHPDSHPAAMITQDATHRFVSDTQIAGWNGKAQAFIFDHSAYASASTSAAQKQIVREIFAAVRAKKSIVVIAQNVAIPEAGQPALVDGLVTLGFSTATEVPGIVQSFAWDSNDGGNTLMLVTALIRFKSDGTVVVERKQLSKELMSWDGMPDYAIVKVATEAGFASTYHLTENGRKIGASINIPLDQVLRGSSIKSVSTAGSPYAGAKVGDKYIEFLFQNNPTPQYLPVQDLVDVYTGDGTYIEVTASNVIQLKYAALKTKLQTDFGSVFDAKGAGAAAAKAAVDEFKASSFVIQCTIPGMN